MKLARFLLILTLSLLLASCAHRTARVKTISQTTTTVTPAAAPIVAPTGPTITIPETSHVVEAGETLAQIAQTYGVDVQRLMDVNHLLNENQLTVGQPIIIPSITKPLPPEKRIYLTQAEVDERVGYYPDSYWRTITLHHSATFVGDMKSFDQDHRRRKLGGLAYHFVIGNGSPVPDGDIQVGWRWLKQVKGVRAYDIQICLVGNFNEQQVSEAQIDSVVKLIDALCAEFHIAKSSIRVHRDIRPTECPGKNFPIQRILQEVNTQKQTA